MRTALAILRVFDDLRTGRLDQLVLVHHLFELVGNELAGADVQLLGVGFFAAGLGDQGAKVAVADQLSDADFEADGVEDVVRPADHARFQAKGCRRQPDASQPRVHDLGIGQELPIHALPLGRYHVGLVDDHQIEGVELARPAKDRLDAGDDHRLGRVAAPEAGRVDAEVELGADRPQLIGRLLQELLDVGQDQDATSAARTARSLSGLVRRTPWVLLTL